MCSSIKRSVLLKKKFIFYLFLVLISLSDLFKCDLPVHCKREQIEGLWTFRIENEKFDAILNVPRTSCGHGFPDKIEKTTGDVNFKFSSFTEIELVLSADYKIYDSKNHNIVVGKWSPVYDEAFVAYYKNSVFTTFMKYYQKEGQYFRSNSDANSNYMSNCDKTMIGWYIPDASRNNKNWSCFFGFKSKIRNEFSPNRFLQINGNYQTERPINAASEGDRNFMEVSTKTENNAGLHLTYDQAELVNEINSMNLSWKADIHEEFKGLSFFELKEKLGLKRNKKRYNDNFNIFDTVNLNVNQPYSKVEDAENLDGILNSWSSLELGDKVKSGSSNTLNMYATGTATATPQSDENMSSILESLGNGNSYSGNTNTNFGNSLESIKIEQPIDEDSAKVSDFSTISKYFDKELNDIDVNSLPKNWDWRNVGGVNFVPFPRRQLNCGSCYIFSLVSSLEARLRILTNNKDQTTFSRQFPLACSFYTEGCQGGYPFLVAKFFNEFEVLPESCAPYNPNHLDCRETCDYTKNPIKYYVSKYEYLGGFYGATSEVDMIKEIRARGPIPGNMSVPWSFSYYKSGIFSENVLKKNSGKFSKTTLFDENLSWSNVDHSILLIGYGEENGIKYWIGMNTWGTQWGENGYFKILRGENNCNIETMGDAARINFTSR